MAWQLAFTMLFNHPESQPLDPHPTLGCKVAVFIVFHFCSEVQTLCSKPGGTLPGQPSHFRGKPGGCPSEVTPQPGANTATSTTTGRDLNGVLILSMDLKQAYDRLPRPALAEGLSQRPRNLILEWLANARYEITHRGRKAHIPTSRGVRQGCSG